MPYDNTTKPRTDNRTNYDRPRGSTYSRPHAPTAMASAFAPIQEEVARIKPDPAVVRARFEAQGPFVKFKGNYYSIALLLKQAGPTIEIESKDLDGNPSAQLWPEVEETVKAEWENMMPIYARYEGKYVLLLGKAKKPSASGVVKGKFLSNPTLKRTVVSEVPEELNRP